MTQISAEPAYQSLSNGPLSSSAAATSVSVNPPDAMPSLLPPRRQLGPQGSVLRQTLSTAFNNTLLAFNLLFQSKMLAALSDAGAGAGAITSTFQSVVLSAATGVLLAVDIEMGGPIGRQEYKVAGDYAKAGWLVALTLGLLCSTAMGISYWLLPVMYPHSVDSAVLAAYFLLGEAIGAPATLFMNLSPNIAFQAGDWYVPTIAALMYYPLSTGLSYLLGFTAGMGAFGIGLGVSIAAWASFFALHGLLLNPRLHEQYRMLQLSNFSVDELSTKVKGLFSLGWQLSFQRLTEWFNVLVLTLLLNDMSKMALDASNASVQLALVMAMCMQGLAAGTSMLIKVNGAKITKALESASDRVNAWGLHLDNILNLIKNNILGVLICGMVAIPICIYRDAVSAFLLGKNIDPNTNQLADTYLWLTMVGYLGDAVRIISLGALRSWREVFVPSAISLTVMTGIGSLLGYLSRDAFSSPGESYWVFRAVTAALAAIIAVKQCHIQLTKEAAPIPEDARLVPAKISESCYGRFFVRTHVDAQSVSMPIHTIAAADASVPNSHVTLRVAS